MAPVVSLFATAFAAALAMVTSESFEEVVTLRCAKNCKSSIGCGSQCKGEQKQAHMCQRKPECRKEIAEKCKGAAPQNCEFSDWAEWADYKCSGLCSRKRAIKVPNRCDGLACYGPLSETKQCPGQCARASKAQDCVLSDWTPWSDCTTNQMERTRKVLTKPEGGLNCDGVLSETAVCGDGVLHAENCALGDWMGWDVCSVSCGGGERRRLRTLLSEATQGGEACSATLAEIEPCGMAPCDDDSLSSGANCVLDAWSAWTECEGAAATQRIRRRGVLVEPQVGGKLCDEALEEVQPCREVATTDPTDCQLSDWTEWGLCDADCDGGQTYRRRKILAEANGGKLCGDNDLMETMACNEVSCSQVHGTPCRAAPWSAWSPCSTTCGAGQQTRSREILTLAANGGAGCEVAMSEAQGCVGNAECTQVDCIWGDWSTWEDCSASCNGGISERSRSIIQEPKGGGNACEAKDSREVQTCNTSPCVALPTCTNGSWSVWNDWSHCSASCLGGYRFRSRSVETVASECGTPAVGPTTEVSPCNSDLPCALDVDCAVGDWANWTECTDACEGTHSRARNIIAHHAGKGKQCAETSLKMVESCAAAGSEHCSDTPRDCVLGDWDDWSQCPVTCGGGQATRKRDVRIPAVGTGNPCTGALQETSGCGSEACEKQVNCKWAEWSDWGMCDKCGGQQFRNRAIVLPPQGGGLSCVGSANETQLCPTTCGAPQFYCAMSEWSEYGPCSKTCGSGGTRTRLQNFRYTENPAGALFKAKGAADCTGTVEQLSACPEQAPCSACVPQHCKFGEWNDWISPNSCEGLCHRSRKVAQPNNVCGDACVGITEDTKECPQDCSVKDCMLSNWTAFSQCTSDNAQKFKARSILVAPSSGGEGCFGELNVTASCGSTGVIVVDCALEPWTSFSDCDRPCGGGQQTRTRTYQAKAQHGGRPCESKLKEVIACNTKLCEEGVTSHRMEDCQLSVWTEWSKCSGASMQQVFRARHIVHYALPGGMACTGELNQTKKCTPDMTLSGEGGEDCVMGEWGGWSACSKSCNGGQQTRSRVVRERAQKGGKQCEGSLLQMQPCGLGSCAADQDCRLQDWVDWSECSVSCGTGTQFRARQIMKGADPGGVACSDALKEFNPCFPGFCKDMQDCQWENWSPWSECIPAVGGCGTGFKFRNRDVWKRPLNGGLLCEPRIMEEVMPEENCNGQQECCVDGGWSDWGEWGSCSATCGTGTHSRTRNVATKPSYCGIGPFGSTLDYASCAAGSCEDERSCSFTAWSTTTDCSSSCHGVRNQSRQVASLASGAGVGCSGAVVRSIACNPSVGEPEPGACQQLQERVPKDCVMSTWSDWTACSATCNTGIQTRSRRVLESPMFGGEACEEDLTVIAACNPEIPCFPLEVDCKWTDWSEWGSCDTASETASRTRGFAIQEAHGGVPCAGPMEENQPCGDSCAVQFFECYWATWTDWTACPEDCSEGVVTERTRILMVGDAIDVASKPVDYSELFALGAVVQSQKLPLAASATLGAMSFLALVAVSRAFGLGRYWRERGWSLPEYSAIPATSSEELRE